MSYVSVSSLAVPGSGRPAEISPRAVTVGLRRILVLAVALGLAGLIAPLHATSAAAASSCSVYWTGTTSASWTLSANWSLTAQGQGAGRIPLSTDFVCLSSAPARTAVTYVSLGRTIAGIDFSTQGSVRPSLIIDGGTLTIGSGSGTGDSVVNDLQVRNGGTVGGTSAVLLTGAPTLSDNAILTGSGTTTLAAGTTVTTNGLVLDNGRRLVNQGTLTHDGCYDYLYLYNGAVLQNAGRFNAASSCGHRVYSDGTAGSTFINSAGAQFVVMQDPTDTYSLDAPLDNRGTVSVTAGSLEVLPIGTTGGSYAVPPLGQLLVTGGTLKVDADTLTGVNGLVLAGGTIDVTSAVTVTALELRSGTLTGNPIVRTLTGGGSATFTGGGVLMIPNAGTATLDSFTVDGGSRLLNRGTLTHIGCGTALNLRAGSVLQNAGTLTVGTNCASSVSTDGSAGVAVINDAGASLTVSQLSAVSNYEIGAALDNQGTFEVTKGKVKILELTNLVAGRLSGGSWIATVGTIEIPGDITTNAGSIALTTSGKLLNPSQGNALARLTANTGSLVLSKGLTFNLALVNSGNLTVTQHQVETTNYRQTGGTTNLTGDGAIISTDGPESMVFDGGTLTGDGRIYSVTGPGTVMPAGELVVSSAYLPSAAGTLAIVIAPSGPPNRLLVNGQASLNGTLQILTAPGFNPAVGTTYTIVSAVRWSGAFNNVVGQNLPGGKYYDLSYVPGAVKLTVRKQAGLSVSDASATVGLAGSTPMEFTVSLAAASSQTVTVDYRTQDGTATAGSDYVAQSGTLTFAPGTTTMPVTITISRDTGPEPVEQFTVELSGPVNAVISVANGTGTITHQAGAPTAPVITGITPPTVGLGANGAQVTVSGRNFLTSSTVTVAGTGLKLVGTDFVDPQTLVLTLNAFGLTTLGPNDVTVTNADVGSDTCAGCLTVVERPQPTSASPDLAVGATAATVTIRGTDFQPGGMANLTGGSGVTVTTTYVSPTALRLSVNVFKTATVGSYDVRVVNPDGGLGFCVGCFSVVPGPTLTSMSPDTVARGSTTNVTLTGSGLATGADLTPPSGVSFSNVVVVNATKITARMTVDPTRGRTDGLLVTVVNPASAGSGAGSCNCLNVATMITIDDAAATVGDGGPVDMTFQISLDSSVPTQVKVDYRTVGGTATQGSDFAGTSGTLTFSPGTITQSVTVTILRDSGPEPVETFTVVLSNPVSAALADSVAVGTITHDSSAAAAPVLTGLSPDTVGPGASARDITLNGGNFEPGTVVSIPGNGVTITDATYVNPTTIRITLSTWATLTPQNRDVTVSTPGAGSSTCTGCLKVTKKPDPTSVSPSLATGASQRTVTVTGTNFKSGATVSFVGGTGVKVTDTQFVSSTTLRLTVDVSTNATIGGYNPKVTNPDGGVGSCASCFTVSQGPTVTSMSPDSVQRGTSTTVTISGTRFVTGAQVIGPDDVSFSNVVVLNATTLTARITVDAGAAKAGNLPVTVVNPASAGYGQAFCKCLKITL